MFLRKVEDRVLLADKYVVGLVLVLILGMVIFFLLSLDKHYKYSNLVEKNEDLKSEIELQSERIDILMLNLEKLAEENDKFNQENNVLMEENENLKEEIEDLEDDLNSQAETNEEEVVASVSRGSSAGRDVLARIINAEAKGEPMNGKIAVGNVVLNRVESSGFPDSIRSVVYQTGQFQPVTNGSINQTPSEKSVQAANRVLNGERVVGSDVLYFYNPAIATDSWIFTRTVVTRIGNHAFAK